jgi:cyclophilin family peptidyl-prolyl cis-trans isomerase
VQTDPRHRDFAAPRERWLTRIAPWPRLVRAVFAAGAMTLIAGASRAAEPPPAAAAPAPENAPAPAAAPAPASSPALKAILEVDRDAYYAGDPVPIRISIWNDSGAPVEAPAGEVTAGFTIYDSDGKRVPFGPAVAPAEKGGAAPRTLQPGGFYGFARDLTLLAPRLKEVGTYRVQWTTGGLTSNAVVLRVVPKYDPEKDYTARVETDLGTFTLEFLRRDAPIAVKTFIELAQSGFYDGVIFHYVEPDRVVVAGDPTGTGQGGPGFSVPHERTQVKMLAGTVLLLAQGKPPANGSIFAILLAPRPDFEGIATGFAQVVEGLDVVRKISEVPAAGHDAPLPHRPVQDVTITRIIIRPKSS